jgi:hypothetical protein
LEAGFDGDLESFRDVLLSYDVPEAGQLHVAEVSGGIVTAHV